MYLNPTPGPHSEMSHALKNERIIRKKSKSIYVSHALDQRKPKPSVFQSRKFRGYMLFKTTTITAFTGLKKEAKKLSFSFVFKG